MKKEKGAILIQTLFFAAIAVLFIGGLTNWAGLTLKAMKQAANRELAFQIAESGIEYYRWHLAHAPQDFQDGQGAAGPYVHDFNNRLKEKIGEFSLNIVPPSTGSTIVTITSTGTVLADPSLSRTIEAKLAIPSWAKYAVAANDDMRFGQGTEVFGPIHSNKGIRFDGVAHNLVTSALAKYNDPDHNSNKEFGIHTHIVPPTEPYPDNPVPNRPDIFMAGRQFPVPAVDFDGITSDLADIKAKAQSSGKFFGESGKEGYHLVLKTNDTFDLYKVTALETVPNGCNNGGLGQSYWSSWSIGTEQLIGNYAIPNNNVIFLEDHTWVSGQIDGIRITIAAGYFPDSASKRKDIVLNENLLYTNYDGADSIALIAQGNINIGYKSEDNLRIDGALIAQNGRIGRFYYGGSQCGAYLTRDSITLFGMMVTNSRYGFAYTDGTGYQIRNLIYDANLLYSPPPEFPLISDQYQIISWREI